MGQVKGKGSLRPAPDPGVIAWLRSPEGEMWSFCRIPQPLESHYGDSGIFADVIDRQPHDWSDSARWPVPFEPEDLDCLDVIPSA